MIKIIHSGFNYGDIVELFYDTEAKKYIFVINGKKKIVGVK